MRTSMIALVICGLTFAVVALFITGRDARADAEFYRRHWIRERQHNNKLFEKFTGIRISADEQETDWSDDVIRE